MTTPAPREFPDVPLTGVTELRIHGVSGTPVTSMLQHPHPAQVSGDALAGFYRKGDDAHPPWDPPPPEGRNLEAYSWGGLTAGQSARAAWLLLLPFMLVNVASWAHPARGGDKSTAVGAMSGLVRFLALTLTAMLVVAAATIGMDVLAWQCAGNETACGGRHFYTKWLTDGWFNRPGARIAFGALLPVVLILVMRRLSRSTAEAYECYESEVPPPTITDEMPYGARDLANPKFWNGAGPYNRLRALHVTAAFAGIAGLVAYAAGAGDPSGWRWAGWVLPWVAAAVVAAVAVALLTPITGRRRELLKDFTGVPPNPLWCRVVAAGPYVAGALLAAALGYAAFLTDRPATYGALAGLHAVVLGLFYVEVGGLVALTVATALAVRARARAKRPADSLLGPLLRGFAAPFVASLGVWLGAAYAAGITLRVADLVGDPVAPGCRRHCGAPTAFLVRLPSHYYWSARTFAVAAGLAFFAILYVLFVMRRGAIRTARPVVAQEYQGFADAGRIDAIAKTHATASLTDRGVNVVAFVVLGGVAAGAVLSIPAVRDKDFVEPLTTAGTWLTGVFAAALVGLGRSAYKSPKLRRTVGILWDLGTFWPRAAHPFAPPCYCERAANEFATRMRQTTQQGSVVVSAHSQGTVIAFATMLQLGDCAPRLALVTYGCPLQRLYARAFPHFFGLPVLQHLNGVFGKRWVNLYRRSDPIGGPVFLPDGTVVAGGPRPDRRLTDPQFAKEPYSFTWPATRGHSDYFHDPAFAATVDALAVEV